MYLIRGDSLALRPDKIYYAPTQQSWTIDLAETPDAKARGLMFVKQMSDDRGMLFKFEEEHIITMWMKNTFIVLDMVFMDASGTITHIHKRAEPHSLDTISSVRPSKYVLEIVGGAADKSNLEVGSKMLHPWFK